METRIDSLLGDYEHGRISRRQLIASVGALALAASGGRRAAAQEAGTFRASSLNHIALNVPDVAVSRDFYVKHLGLKVAREGANNCFLTCNDNFLALFRSRNAGLNHYCFSVERYAVADAERKLDAEGLNPRREGNRIYFKDPDGITVQLAAGDHNP